IIPALFSRWWKRVEIVFSPAAGQADIIVDITSTGSTLTANHLKILSDGIIVRSEACFVRARKPEHDGDGRIEEIASHIRAAV
ncbi:MAG: hypothetical protein J0G97_18305, partial [Rhizobium pusense]|nr:hypothetical protein [Agrobacterium pusense]